MLWEYHSAIMRFRAASSSATPDVAGALRNISVMDEVYWLGRELISIIIPPDLLVSKGRAAAGYTIPDVPMTIMDPALAEA